MWNLKNSTNFCRAAVKTQTQRTDLWTQWSMERSGRMNVTLKHISNICRISQCIFAVWHAGSSVWCSVITWRVGMGWEEGSSGRGHMYTNGWFMLMNGRNHHNIVKQFSSVQSLSCVWLFATPWTAAFQASLSINNSQGLLKLISFRMDWLDLLEVQGTLKSLLHHHSSKKPQLFGTQLSL